MEMIQGVQKREPSVVLQVAVVEVPIVKIHGKLNGLIVPLNKIVMYSPVFGVKIVSDV